MDFILGKYIKHYAKETVKALKFIIIATAIIIGIIAIKFKPAYEVSISGKTVGYIADKDRLEKKISNFLNNTTGCIAFIESTVNPEYKLLLVDRNKKDSEKEILAFVEEKAITTYKTYAININGEEKARVETQAEAEEIVNNAKQDLKEEVGLDFAITEKFETTLNASTKEIASVNINNFKAEKVKAYEEAKAAEERRKAEEAAAKARAAASSGSVNTSLNVTYDNNPIQIAFIQPVSGMISSRFGERSSRRSSVHTGLDIAGPAGTPIKAIASGTVSFAGYKGAYGNLIVVNHTDGVQSYYAHCSSINVSAGQTISQGEIVGHVGSTGNSTGPHLHLEIRINGIAQNPQNYLYK